MCVYEKERTYKYIKKRERERAEEREGIYVYKSERSERERGVSIGDGILKAMNETVSLLRFV